MILSAVDFLLALRLHNVAFVFEKSRVNYISVTNILATCRTHSIDPSPQHISISQWPVCLKPDHQLGPVWEIK